MAFILTFSLLSIVLLVGLVVYLCPPTTNARSRSFLAQQEEWLYLRRFPLPKEVVLLNFELFRLGALTEGQHALIVDDHSIELAVFDYVTVEEALSKQTAILLRNKSLDSFILRALPLTHADLPSDAMTAERPKTLEIMPSSLETYRIETNQSFRAQDIIASLEEFIREHPGICIEYIGNTLLIYKPNTCLSQEQLDVAMNLARKLFRLLSR